MKGVFNPIVATYAKVMSAEKYAIPRFQRDYSWKEPNWFELWQDVKSILSGEYKEKYMGFIVLHQKESDGDNMNEIIDGQQRLITISLMLLAFIRVIEKREDYDDEAKRQIGIIKTKYIAEQDVDKSLYSYKLKLNDNNNFIYQSFINGSQLPTRKKLPSETLMIKCLAWFTQKVAELNYDDSVKLGTAVKGIADSLYFTTIHVLDDENAYIVFETLNARGVKLSSSDLLKNYLFQKISPLGEDRIKEVEAKWRYIVQKIGSDDLVDFIRYYWNSRYEFVRKVDLYRAIIKKHSTTENVLNLVEELLKSSDIYAALANPHDEHWKNNERIEESLKILKLFKLNCGSR